MPRGAVYSDKILGKIEVLHDEGLSLREIATKLEISKTGVEYIVGHIHIKRKQHIGRKRKLSDRDVGKIQRDASNKITSASRILRDGG